MFSMPPKEGLVPLPCQIIFSAYADTAYTLEQMGQVVDLSPYLTEKEKAAYLPNYLEEGDFSDDGSIHIILTTSTKFLRIMEMASIELGGYEMRFDLNTVYVTKNLFSHAQPSI